MRLLGHRLLAVLLGLEGCVAAIAVCAIGAWAARRAASAGPVPSDG